MTRALPMLILFLAPWPVLRACVSRPFRRRFRRLIHLLAIGLAGYGMAIVVIAALVPFALWPLAAMALLVVGAERWRARPGYGRRRGLPPGSLGLLPLGFWFERDFLERRFARYGPIVKVHPVLRPVVCVRGLAYGLDLASRGTDELVPIPLGFSRFIPGGFLRSMDGETHRRYRQQFQRVFSAAVVDHHEPAMRRHFRAALDRLAADGPAHPEPYIRDAMFAIWMRLFFEIEPGTAAYAHLRSLYRIIDMRNPEHADDASIGRAVAAIRDHMRARLREPAAADGSFARELARIGPDAVDDATATGNLIYVAHTSWSDLSGLLLWTSRMLGEHPSWLARVRESDPVAGEDLATRIILETLRLAQMEHMYREAVRDLRIGAFLIPKGWLVRICVRESHLDATVFPSPGTFDPDRHRDRVYAPSEFAPFGVSAHACLGQQLTRTVGRVFVSELAGAFDCTIEQDAAPELSSWLHWHPSPALRLRLTRRTIAA